jgi:hypothetical protein
VLWVVACLGVLLGGLALPWVARIAFGLILVATNVPALRTAALLRGRRAVRIVEWDEGGRFELRSPTGENPGPATLRPASFRLGIAFLVLWFATPTGSRVVLVDAGCQDPVAFRRLSRHLARVMLIPSRPKV